MNKLILAPLHEVNCMAFRMLCKSHGADILYTPMINCKSLIANPDNFNWLKKENPLAVQLIGNDEDEFRECCQRIKNCDFIDLNAGCPSHDNISGKMGAYLLQDLDNFKKIIKSMAKYSSVPVSVKIRLGWKKDESLKIAKIAQESGAQRIAVHGRKFGDNYSVPADWEAIAKIKKGLKIPVFANGDIDSPFAAKKCLEMTNAEGLMIGREAIKNPFIFNDIKHYFKKNEIISHEAKDRIGLIFEFLELSKKYSKYEPMNFSSIRKQCIWLCHGMKGAAKIRDELGKAKDENEIRELLNKSF